MIIQERIYLSETNLLKYYLVNYSNEKFISKQMSENYPNTLSCSIPVLQMGNHDTKRMTTKKGAQYASVLNMLLLLLPGTPTTYQGEEFGMLDTQVSFEETQDPWGKNFGPVSTQFIIVKTRQNLKLCLHAAFFRPVIWTV